MILVLTSHFLDINPQQNWIGKFFIYFSLALNFKKFVLALIKSILKFFSVALTLPLISSVGSSVTIICMRWWTIVNTKNYNVPSKVVTKTPWTCFTKCYSIALYTYLLQSPYFTVHIFTNIAIYYYIVRQ